MMPLFCRSNDDVGRGARTDKLTNYLLAHYPTTGLPLRFSLLLFGHTHEILYFNIIKLLLNVAAAGVGQFQLDVFGVQANSRFE